MDESLSILRLLSMLKDHNALQPKKRKREIEQIEPIKKRVKSNVDQLLLDLVQHVPHFSPNSSTCYTWIIPKTSSRKESFKSDQFMFQGLSFCLRIFKKNGRRFGCYLRLNQPSNYLGALDFIFILISKVDWTSSTRSNQYKIIRRKGSPI